MSRRILDFGPDEQRALRFARAMNRVQSLPRCDHPKWDAPNVEGEARRDCPCRDRSRPVPLCDFTTWAHVSVDVIDGTTYCVRVTPEILAAAGQRVTVDGREIVIDVSGDRQTTPAEDAGRRPHWRGDRSDQQGGVDRPGRSR